MSTFIYQVTVGSASAATDLAIIPAGRVASGDISVLSALTASVLTYQIATYDASGRAFIVGSIRTSASYVAGVTHGVLSYAVATTTAPTLGDSRAYPLFMDLAGNLKITASAVLPVGVTGTAFIQGSATVSGQVTAIPASSTALTADGIGAVSGQTVAAFAYIKSSGANTWDRWAVAPSGATASAGMPAGMVSPMWQYDDSGSQVSAQQKHFGVPRMSQARIAYVTATAAWPVGVTGSAFVQQGGVWGVTASAVTASVQTITATQGATVGVTVSTATGGSVVTILAANASRKGCLLTNNGAGQLYLGFATTVSAAGATMGLLIGPSGSYTDFGFSRSTGALYGVYSTAATAANVSISEWV